MSLQDENQLIFAIKLLTAGFKKRLVLSPHHRYWKMLVLHPLRTPMFVMHVKDGILSIFLTWRKTGWTTVQPIYIKNSYNFLDKDKQ